jgi:hypothetical protein
LEGVDAAEADETWGNTPTSIAGGMLLREAGRFVI